MQRDGSGCAVADSRDPFGILRDNNPVDPQGIDPYSTKADALLAAVTAELRRRTVPRRRLVIVAVAIVALTTGVAMTIALTQRDITNMAITCYEAVSLESSRAGMSADGPPTASMCEQPWSDGELTMEGLEPGEVPPLSACVNDLGGLAVFPTDDPLVCEQLGLAVPTPGQSTSHFDTTAAAKEDIFNYLVSDACRPLDEAEVVFREIFDRHGLTDWTVVRRPDHPGRPCASIAYHIEDKMLVIVPDTSNPGFDPEG